MCSIYIDPPLFVKGKVQPCRKCTCLLYYTLSDEKTDISFISAALVEEGVKLSLEKTGETAVTARTKGKLQQLQELSTSHDVRSEVAPPRISHLDPEKPDHFAANASVSNRLTPDSHSTELR